ncbi:hypothetical protein RISW2_22595 [Roseivivax isoporae LMG 25204]|uniref:Lipoprotein n=1 Tax=Roseivivax isoporae LMG 25204 TaxID=1449351 RepID=X7FC56_9RHOB|nr:hypothetical protein RISW2_22595 [Roseivivax isoporae LMG 25204]
MRAVLPLSLVLALASCGSDQERVRSIDVLRQIGAQIGSGRPAPLPEATIMSTLGQLRGPVTFVEVESRGGQALFVPVQRNGAYTTYATPAGASVVFRDGFVVQTRGLGGDLMSTDEDALLSLIRARQRGTAPYVMRHLDGENHTVTDTYTCNVLPQGREDFASGEVRARGTRLHVHCVSDGGRDFVSLVLVDDAGRVLSAQQFVGGLSEFLNYRVLRR